MPRPCCTNDRGGADHLLFFALGKNDAARLPAQALEHALQHARDRIAPRAQLLPVGFHVDDRPARDAESIAACATAGGMEEISRGSNGTGMM